MRTYTHHKRLCPGPTERLRGLQSRGWKVCVVVYSFVISSLWNLEFPMYLKKYHKIYPFHSELSVFTPTVLPKVNRYLESPKNLFYLRTCVANGCSPFFGNYIASTCCKKRSKELPVFYSFNSKTILTLLFFSQFRQFITN